MGRLCMELYLKELKKRYRIADRKSKSLILDELCSNSQLHRKHAIRLLSNQSGKPPRQGKTKRGRKPEYKPERLLEPLKRIWFATEQMCGKRLKEAIKLWLPFYEPTYGKLDAATKRQLVTMSSATIDRLLSSVRARYPKRIGGTKPGSILKKQIPVKTDQWDEKQPGYVEADTVAHCGGSLMGDFVWTLTLTDICTGWTENRALWGKGAAGVVSQINDIENQLPFPILGFDCDNGSEFLNHHLIRYFQDHITPVQFTRSRPYHKDDNAHVEQKNWTHVRQLWGYHRIDNKELVEEMNDVYKNECSLLRNYFYPAMKLVDKRRIQSKIKKIHTQPKTPYQRVMESPDVDAASKEELTKIYPTLNPFELRKALERKLKRIFAQIDLHSKGRRTAI